jgi:hypothetical protein
MKIQDTYNNTTADENKFRAKVDNMSLNDRTTKLKIITTTINKTKKVPYNAYILNELEYKRLIYVESILATEKELNETICTK